MSRKLRHMEFPREITEITFRCIQNRFLLRPSKRLNQIILGIIGRAQHLFPEVDVYGFFFASNHGHIYIASDNVIIQAKFVGYVLGNLAREVGILHGWKEKVFGKRFTPIGIKDHESLVRKMSYLNSHGMKENLVRRPKDWPGVSCYRALAEGRPLEGIWVDRTAFYRDSRNGKNVRLKDYETKYEVKLTPFPFLQVLPVKEQQAYFKEQYKELQEDNRLRRIAEGSNVLGRKAILKQNPYARPVESKKSPAPWCFAITKRRREQYKQAYKRFEAAYRTDADLLKQGKQNVRFPDNCFPPPLYCAPQGSIISFAPG